VSQTESSSEASEPSAVTPFRISVPDADLADLKRRLEATRWPDQIPGQQHTYGADKSELQTLVAYWLDQYDWRSAEAELNQWPQFTTHIDNEQVHFLHIRSESEGAVPLLLTHGWPGSVMEFVDLIEPMTSPSDGTIPFHLVIPSLPGFGFSGPTTTTGLDPQRVAEMWVQLMATLGYDGYIAQGGDWGAVVTAHIGHLDPDHCIGIHLNMLTAQPSADQLESATEDQKLILADMVRFRTEETGYHAIQSTKPQTLSYALTDSPAGLCAWIYEKFVTWTDCERPDGERDVFAVVDRDRFLTNVMIYWLTNTAGSSARIYYEFAHLGRRIPKHVAVPTAGADFPKDIYRASREWMERAFNIVHWSTFESGGHFAAMERPEAFIADIRSFVDEVTPP